MMPIDGVDWTFHTGVTGNCYMYFNLLYDRSESDVNNILQTIFYLEIKLLKSVQALVEL